MYIFLDESGQFSKNNGEDYFVVGSFTVGNQRRTNKAMRSWFRSRFPKKMRTQSEVKWSASGIDDKLRMKTIKHIADMDVRIRYGYMLKKNIPTNFYSKGRLESGTLYTNIIGDILESYLPVTDKEIYIFCDKRSLKGIKKKEFESLILNRLAPLCSSDTLLQVKMIDSTTNANIQIADWIAGALYRYLEKRPCGDEYYKILKNNLLEEGKEFFTG